VWMTPHSIISTLNLRPLSIYCSNPVLKEILNRGHYEVSCLCFRLRISLYVIGLIT